MRSVRLERPSSVRAGRRNAPYLFATRWGAFRVIAGVSRLRVHELAGALEGDTEDFADVTHRHLTVGELTREHL